MALVDINKSAPKHSEPRRGGDPGDSAYLQLVGHRVRAQRRKLGISRKTLSQNSGVSERYLAELERGSGNASLLVLRSVAAALGLRVDDLAYEVGPEHAANDDHTAGEFDQDVGKIVLVGLRGAGKSTLGRATAARFGVPFIELNDEVERVAGMDVSEIFAGRGEAVYRELERTALEAVLKANDNVVVATGGGIVTDWESFQSITEDSFVVWVKTTAEVLFERARKTVTLGEKGLTRKAMTEIEAALAAREPHYAKASAIVDTTDAAVPQAVAALVEIIEDKDLSE